MAVCLGELDAVCGFNKMDLLVKKAISVALDRSAREKEMVAVALAALSPEMLDERIMAKGMAKVVCATVREISQTTNEPLERITNRPTDQPTNHFSPSSKSTFRTPRTRSPRFWRVSSSTGFCHGIYS
jgi:hypothetical protein